MRVEISTIRKVIGAGEGSEEIVGTAVDGRVADDEKGGD